MSSRNNYSNSNQTTSANSHIDLLATEETLKKIQTSLNGVSSVNTSDSITHTKLDHISNVDLSNILNEQNTANETLTSIFNKNLNSNNDSVTAVVPNLNFTTDSVNVVEQVSSIPYDLSILGNTMYADSINSAIVDPFGRNGWYWTNSATTGGSNCYWYSNTLVPQNNMSKEQIECAYVVMALDRVDPSIVLPIFAFYSQPSGSGDYIPGFAHSVWTYTIPATHILNAGEVVMLTVGDYTKVANIHPELRRVHLELSQSLGDCAIYELINYISLNTDSGLKDIGAIQYLLQNAGFYYAVTQKTVDYVFNNSIDRKIKDVLLGTDGAINVNIVSGGSGSSLVQIQGYEGTGWANLTSTSGALNTTDSATTSLDGKIHSATLVDTEAIKVYQVNSSSSSSNIQAVLPSAPTVPVPLSATTYNDGTYDHYSLETFDNTLNSKIHSATLVDTEAIKVYQVNSSGGSGGLVQLQAYNTSTSAYEDLRTTATGGLLQVQARTHDYSGNDISSTVVNTIRGLNVNVIGNDNLGSIGNIYSGTLTTGSASTGINIANTYLNNCILMYEDASTSLTTGLAVQVSTDNTTYYTLCVLYPTTAQSGKRAVSSALKLKPFPYIRILNIGVSSYTSIVCSLFSS